jgi:hypothetical protein
MTFELIFLIFGVHVMQRLVTLTWWFKSPMLNELNTNGVLKNLDLGKTNDPNVLKKKV